MSQFPLLLRKAQIKVLLQITVLKYCQIIYITPGLCHPAASLVHDYKSENHMMAEQKDPISSGSLTLSTNGKSDVEVRREKKKKLAAFKTFLDNKLEPSPLQDLPARRKLSETEVQEEKLQSASDVCKICNQPQVQGRVCEFCRDSVCSTHLRKRRRNPDTNKWTRICEYCEDKYLMEKHYQNEMKTEESLISQETILRTKHAEMAEVIASKKIKLQLITNKRNQMIEAAKKENARLVALQADLDKKTRRLEVAEREVGNLELSLSGLEKILPPSLEADYRFLQEENARITGDLVRFEKLCIDAVKARSQRQKDMYEEYYEWERQRKEEMEASEQKQEECSIY